MTVVAEIVLFALGAAFIIAVWLNGRSSGALHAWREAKGMMDDYQAAYRADIAEMCSDFDAAIAKRHTDPL